MATDLTSIITKNVAALRDACAGLDEATASRAPEGRWSPKEILSHILGSGPGSHVAFLRTFLDQDTPDLDLHVAQTHYSPDRAGLTVPELLNAVEKEFAGVAAFAAGLTEAQLARTARVAALKDSPLGEFPSLGAMLEGLCGFHLQFHADHLREVRRELGAGA